MTDVRVTSKKEGIVFGSDPSGGIKVSLHGRKKEEYKKMKRGQLIKI